ncbi:MAG: hypothetical protein IT423_11785 [Pirellulaceae bacterium]|nr:hypothetical protein [Pirellulaceae bacterium]
MTLGNSPPHFHMRISTPILNSILTLTLLFAIRADSVHGQQLSARPADTPAVSSPAAPVTPAPVSPAPITPAPPAPATQRDLTEGLLDLLQEPAKNEPDPKASKSGAKPSNAQVEPKSSQPAIESTSQPASDSSKRTSGEDIGEPPLDPLTEVQLGMSTAAARLRTRTELVKTQGLQRDIVARLDDLIGQLEQRADSENNSSQSNSDQSNSDQSNSDQSTSDPNNSSSNNSSSTPGNASNRTQSSALPPNSLSPSANNQSPDRRASDRSSADKPSSPSDRSPNNSAAQPSEGQSDDPSNDQEGSQDSTGQDGRVSQPGTGSKQARQIVVDLNDPAALQRSAWGSLPERVREQMQSRMVERFLPGYREEIEAYYRALAK